MPAESVQWPSELDFTRFPVRIAIALCDSDEQSALYARILVTTRFNKEIILKALPLGDNLVADGVWYPIDEDDLRTVRPMWEQIETSHEALSLSAYVTLTAHPDANRYVVERLKSTQSVLPRLIPPGSREYPGGLNQEVVLYPYQVTGWRWLRALKDMKLGAILADEMGLGKTLQVIALFADDPPSPESPALVVVPSSLIANWEREISKFAGHLTFTIHRGAQRTSNYRELTGTNILLTTYDVLWPDLSILEQVNWSTIVLDEAHYVRNPNTQRARALSNLKKCFAIAVTGTPMQNYLRDVWSLFDFVLPGYCGTASEFESLYGDSIQDALHLAPRLSPFMLRRRVVDVAGDLPALITIPQPIEMNDAEATSYENLRLNILSNGNHTLATIAPLRQLCCHPRLRDPLWNNVDLTQSEKFKRLSEILFEIRQLDEKCLVFTSFNEMAKLIGVYVTNNLRLPAYLINGETPIPIRQQLIDDFSTVTGSAVMILNPAAGGVGLNIQAANHVIHYNLEWNPAIEDQATARAYRRGQEKPVTVHRLFYKDTIEQAIDSRLELKRDLIESAVKGVKGDDDDIELALHFSPKLSRVALLPH